MKKILNTFLIALILVFAVTVIVEAAAVVTFVRTIGDDGSDMRVRDVTIALDNSYPTGGEEVTAAQLHLENIYSVNCQVNDGYLFDYDYTNSKLLAYGVSSGFQGNISEVTKPVLTLTNTADAGSSEAALPVYVVEANGVGPENILSLQSTTASNADVLASFEETTGDIAPGTPRYWVEDSDSPAGVLLYARDSDHRLQFISPTEQDAYIIAPIEAIADTVPGFALKIKVYHTAAAATSSSVVYFDDNGGADAQLLKTGAGAIVAGDIEVIGQSYDSALVSGTLSQILNTTDLSAVTDIRCRATGGKQD